MMEDKIVVVMLSWRTLQKLVGEFSVFFEGNLVGNSVGVSQVFFGPTKQRRQYELFFIPEKKVRNSNNISFQLRSADVPP